MYSFENPVLFYFMMIHNSNLIKESLLKYEIVLESFVPCGKGERGTVRPCTSQPAILPVSLATPQPGLGVGCLAESGVSILGYTLLL